jgi:hypothetical protein
MDESLATALPGAPPQWSRHVDADAREVEYRYTVGRAARAKLTVRATADGYRLASKRGCRTVSETTVASPADAAAAVRAAFERD